MYHNIEIANHARGGFKRITECQSLEDSKRVAHEWYTDLDGYINEIEYAPMEHPNGDIISYADARR